MSKSQLTKLRESLDGQHFLVEVGDAPSFLVPDTGEVGAKITLDGPGGKQTLEQTLSAPGHAARSDEEHRPAVRAKDGRVPALPARVGAQVPAFEQEGDYTLKFEQEAGTITYHIRVIQPDPGELRLPANDADFVAHAQRRNAHIRAAAQWKRDTRNGG